MREHTEDEAMAVSKTEMTQALDGTISTALKRRDIDEFTWRALMQSVYPGATTASVFMIVDYCKARKLDPLKKVAHIVPMQVKNAQTGRYDWRDVVMPSIAEARITASRTGRYCGQDEPVFGPEIDYLGVLAPQWCKVTVYKMVDGIRCAFSHTERFTEICVKANNKDDKGNIIDQRVNAMWSRRPYGQLAKCAEAGALRKAFPEELGGQYFQEEMEGRRLDDDLELPEPIEGSSATTDKPVAATRTASVKQKLAQRNPRKAEATTLEAAPGPSESAAETEEFLPPGYGEG